MSKKRYHIYAYKHYWPPHLDLNSPHYDPDTRDIPMPYKKDVREYVIEANNEGEALGIAEIEYGSGERTGKNGEYLKNPDGSWTRMGIKKVEILE
jgi:hypothetical protein